MSNLLKIIYSSVECNWSLLFYKQNKDLFLFAYSKLTHSKSKLIVFLFLAIPFIGVLVAGKVKLILGRGEPIF